MQSGIDKGPPKVGLVLAKWGPSGGRRGSSGSDRGLENRKKAARRSSTNDKLRVPRYEKTSDTLIS